MPNKFEKLLNCSFCGKSQHEVQKLLTGPDNRTNICDECAKMGLDILLEDENIVGLEKFEGLRLFDPTTEPVVALVDRIDGNNAHVEFANALLEVLQKDLPDEPHLTNLVQMINKLLKEVITKTLHARLERIEELLKPVMGLQEEADEIKRRLELLKNE